ncbi:unnamed protein product, partial [Trichobilharzia regenti]
IWNKAVNIIILLLLHCHNTYNAKIFFLFAISISENLDLLQIPFDSRYAYSPRSVDRISVLSPETQYMSSQSNYRSHSNNLHKRYRSMECGLNDGYFDDSPSTKSVMVDTPQERNDNNNSNSNPMIEDVFPSEHQQNHSFSSNNNRSRTRNFGKRMNVPPPNTEQYEYSQEPQYASLRIPSSCSDYYNHRYNQKSPFYDSIQYDPESYLRKFNKSPNVSRKDSLTEKIHSHYTTENDNNFNSHTEEHYKTFQGVNEYPINSYQNDNNNNNTNHVDNWNVSVQKINALLNPNDSRFSNRRGDNTPEMFKLRKTVSQSCIYEKPEGREEKRKSSYLDGRLSYDNTTTTNNNNNNNPFIPKENDFNNIISSTESLDQEILDLCPNDSFSQLNEPTDPLNMNNHQRIQGINQMVNGGSIMQRVHKLPKHIEDDKEKDYESTSSSKTEISTSSADNNPNHNDMNIQSKSSEFDHMPLEYALPTQNEFNMNNSNETEKSLYQQEDDSHRLILLQKQSNEIKNNSQFDYKQSRYFDTVPSDNTTEPSIYTVKILKRNTSLQNDLNTPASNSDSAQYSSPECKAVTHTPHDVLQSNNNNNNNNELDLTNDSGVSSVAKDAPISNGVIYVRKVINNIVFGPCNSTNDASYQNSNDCDTMNTPTWLAVCNDEMKVIVYDLWVSLVVYLSGIKRLFI